MGRHRAAGDAGLRSAYISARNAAMGPILPMTGADDTRRKRLLFRSWHRGTKETDLLLGSFAEQHLAGFTTEQLDRYEALLENDDGDLYDWITGRASVPVERDDEMVARLRAFKFTARPA
jgi:antitoxin CptB